MSQSLWSSPLSPTVGRSLHDPDCVHQEQSDYFLYGLGGSRHQCGSSLSPAVVSSDAFKHGLLVTMVTTCSFACFFFISRVCHRRSMLPDVVDDFKVKNPDIRGYEAIFLLLLRLLHQVCVRRVTGHLHTQPRVSYLYFILQTADSSIGSKI